MEISPLQSLRQSLSRWWLVTLLIILGGLGGWAFHQVQPPVYDAMATFTVTIDFAQTGPLDEREQDQAINAFQAVILSPEVAERVALGAKSQYSPAETLDIGQVVYLERRQSTIELHVRNTDPQRAAAIANLWADQAYAVLVEAYGHSLQAWSLRQYLTGLTNCLQIAQADPQSLCGSASFDQLDLRRQKATSDLAIEAAASRTLLPALMFDLASHAEAPAIPVSYQRTGLILAGVLIGLIAGLTLAVVFRQR